MFEEMNYDDYPPVLKETLERIDSMGKKELRELAKSLLLNLAEVQEKQIELKKRYDRNSADYLSRCRSSGGITIPPNC